METLFAQVFYKPLAVVFGPINAFLGWLPNWMATVCGVGLFVSAMIWVGVLLNQNYVNRGRPYKVWYTDLRLWTVISMLPHVAVYLYFR